MVIATVARLVGGLEDYFQKEDILELKTVYRIWDSMHF